MKVPLTQSSSGTGHRALFSKICQVIKYLILVPNIIVGAVDDDGGHEGPLLVKSAFKPNTSPYTSFCYFWDI